MMSENRPKLEWRVRVVAPKHSRQVICSLTTIDREGTEVRLRSWEWMTGRPSPDELLDLVATVSADIQSCIVTFIGVQGVL